MPVHGVANRQRHPIFLSFARPRLGYYGFMKFAKVLEPFHVELRRITDYVLKAYRAIEEMDEMAMHGLGLLLRGPWS